MQRSLQIFFSICFLSLNIFSQQHTIMSYNLLNYPGSTGAIRNPYFIIVLSNTEPDIIVAQEVISQSSVNEFVSEVLMQVSTDYDAGLFVNGDDTDNAIFFKTSLFTFIANNPIHTALRDINEFILMHKATGDTIRIYSLHLKASQGSDNEQKRAAEIDSLRKETDALHPASHFIVTGDFNIYRSTEPAYQNLLNQTNSGYVLDPIDTPGNWHNNFSFASIHTQSPRTRQFQGGANGGMDDRFDMILISQSISDGDGISYVSDTYTAYGNDGNHFNDSINAPPNTAVGQEIADAIHYASDHIPLFASFTFEPMQSIAVVVPNGFENWMMGSTQDIIWSGANVDNVKIELSLTEGMSWETLIDSIPSTGLYTWVVNTSMPSFYCLIRISDITDESIYDISDDVFTIDIFTSVEDYLGDGIPTEYNLIQNFPNPFNPSTTIYYSIPQLSFVTLRVYDVLGNEITVLVNEEKSIGNYEIDFDGEELTTGIYFYRLQAGSFVETKKMILLK